MPANSLTTTLFYRLNIVLESIFTRSDHSRGTASTPFIPAPLPLLPVSMHGAAARGDERLDEDEEDDTSFDEIQGGYTPYLGRLTAVACLGGLQFGWVSEKWLAGCL